MEHNTNKGGQNEGVHSVLLAAVGGYVLYLAYSIVKNALEGDPSMSLTMAALIGGAFALAGTAVIGYAALLWRRQKKGGAPARKSEEEDPSRAALPADEADEEE